MPKPPTTAKLKPGTAAYQAQLLEMEAGLGLRAAPTPITITDEVLRAAYTRLDDAFQAWEAAEFVRLEAYIEKHPEDEGYPMLAMRAGMGQREYDAAMTYKRELDAYAALCQERAREDAAQAGQSADDGEEITDAG